MSRTRLPAVLAAAALTTAAAAARAADGSARPPGFDVAHLDRSVAPCDDFYQFACGGWVAANPIPADRPRWTRFTELAERNQATLRAILEEAAREDAARETPVRLAGDLYAACMDEAAAERKGVEPIRPWLARIAGMESKAQLAALVADLQRSGIGVLFGFGSQQDFKDATRQIAFAGQGGMGLPDRDYYLKEDAKSVEQRAAYEAHVKRSFELLGEPPETAAAAAATVLRIETELARAALERVQRREPANVYHPMTLAELQALAPAFDWAAFVAAAGAPAFESLNVSEPDFARALGGLVERSLLADLQAYLRWHVVRARSPQLSAAFVEQDFAFYGRTLQGTRELRPRWKRCVEAVDRALGDALGRLYVERAFAAESKQRMLAVVVALEQALRRDIETLEWMSASTRQQALAKLEAIANKIGYPESWRDYAGVVVRRDDLVGSLESANAYERARALAKIGQPVNRQEWSMSTPTVNAFYRAQLNDINFPAGILQPPFFDPALDDAVNFGAIGAVIGHELTHGFDDRGRKFAGSGNLEDWWTPEDARAFEERAACVERQYAGYTAVADVKLNGKLTLGENVADNGGLRIAMEALQATLASKPAAAIDGFTPPQRVLLGWAQVWCQNQTDEMARMLALTDPHSPGRYRVNGVLANMPEFAAAFACPADAPMVSKQPCRVW